MKVFPLLIKELLEKKASEQQTASPAEVSSPKGEDRYNSADLLAVIPEVSDPPISSDPLDPSSSKCLGGTTRLFSPSLSARILLAGGVLLFLIAAVPGLFRSPRTGESESPKQSAPSERSSSTVSNLSPFIPAPSSSSKRIRPTAPGSSGGSVTHVEGKAGACPAKTSSQGGKTPSFRKASESLAQAGEPKKKVSQADAPDSGRQAGGAETLAEASSQNPPSSLSAAEWKASEGFSPSVQKRFPEQTGGQPARVGMFDSQASGVGYPTTSLHLGGQPLVYYPGTDGRWYPVAFPPRRPVPQMAACAWRREHRIAHRELPPRDSGPEGWSSGGGVGTQYSAAFSKERGSFQTSGWDERRAAGGARKAASPAGPPTAIGSYSGWAQRGSPSYPVPASSRSGDWAPSEAGAGASGRAGFDAPTYDLPIAGEEPGVARLKGTVELPVRSAYEGTGSSLY